jgi:putative Ca2+/H+ antiporter (TMEM165/GDT1 family)
LPLRGFRSIGNSLQCDELPNTPDDGQAEEKQLATMLFAADKEVSKWTVFLGASAALAVATAIGVIAGTLLSEFINEKYLNYLAGAGFRLIGAFTLVRA